jgi:teichuronic acid biosynthesis glycosyltransferase TuaG
VNLNNSNLISIVCASYNSKNYITETINSVLNQDYKNWELLIIDDCSTDDTFQIVESKAKNDHRIKTFKNITNSGSGFSRNIGIKNAKGNYLTFIDSDDLWDSNFLGTSLNFQIENGYCFSFASYRRLNEDLVEILSPFIVPEKVSYKDMLKTGSISCLTAFINIKQLGKNYMPQIRKRQDYVFFLSYLKQIDYAYGIKNVLASYRIRKNSISRNKFDAMKYIWIVYRDIEKLSLLNSLFLMLIYSCNGLKKYYFIRKK